MPLPHFEQYGSDREIYNDIWLLESNLKTPDKCVYGFVAIGSFLVYTRLSDS